MTHIDEGTIHAWLDGALTEVEARDVGAHVAECAQCAAAVAEARGFIAGASRILNALDDVPANVTPKRAVAPVRPARRQWRAAPWVTGIAAALILAVGVTTFNRGGARMASDASFVLPVVDSAGPTVDTARQAQAAASGAEVADRAANTPGGTAAATVSPPAVAQRQSVPRVRTPSPSVGSESAQRMVAQMESRAERAPAAAADFSGRGAERDVASAKRADHPDSTLVGRAKTMQVEPVAVTGSSISRAGIVADSAAASAGCYRVAMAAERAPVALSEVVPLASARGAAAESRRRTAAPAAAAAPAPPPAAARERADFAASTPAALLALDTTRVEGGFLVRAPRSDSTLGSWLAIPGDSVRVTMRDGGVLTFARQTRSRCPER